MSTTNCPSCGAPISVDAKECKYCGEKVQVQMPQNPQQMQQQQPVQPQYANVQPQTVYIPVPMPAPAMVPVKSKVAAGLLALFLGGLGAHKFYLNKPGQGILYLIFCWTFIPLVISFIEGIVYLASSDADFNYKYVR